MENINWSSLIDGPLNILPYGEPGCGKTRFLGSVGEVLYTLGVDVDNGFQTLIQIPKPWRDNIYPIRLTEFKDIDMLYKLLGRNDPEEMTRVFNAGLAEDDARYKVVKKPFDAVGFDTWSEVNWTIKEQKRKDIKKGGDGSLVFRPNIEIQDWGNIIDLNQVCIQAFRELPITFICCMHEMFFEDKKGGRTSGTPSINGKFAAEIGKHFDIVGHMHMNLMGQYVMDTQAKQKYQAKSRLALDKEIVFPTYKKIIDSLAALSKTI